VCVCVCVCVCVFVCIYVFLIVCHLETSTNRRPLVRVGLLRHIKRGGKRKKSKAPRKLFVAVK